MKSLTVSIVLLACYVTITSQFDVSGSDNVNTAIPTENDSRPEESEYGESAAAASMADTDELFSSKRQLPADYYVNAPSSSSSHRNRKIVEKRLMVDDKMEKIGTALVEYHKLLRNNPQLTVSQKKVILIHINDLLIEMKKLLSENPDREYLLKKLPFGHGDFGGEQLGEPLNPDHQPFKWGK
jgi:hypothetical protein